MKKSILNIFFILLISCGTIYKNSRPLTKSIVVTEPKANEINELFNYGKSDFFTDSIKVEFNVIKEEKYNNFIEISIIQQTDTIRNQIQIIGSLLHSNDNIYIDIFNSTCYISWISEPNYDPKGINKNHAYELYLKSINLITGKENFNEKIYSTKCCIDRLSMKYNPFTASVLFSFNDYSRPESKYLMFGAFKIKDNKPIQKELIPEEIISQDQSEKRFPQFLIDKNNVYLYHTSGDRWGFFEYKGKQQIGFSRIDNNNAPIDYKIIMDSCAIQEKLFLINDTLYFRVRVVNNNKPDKMLIKKVALNDITKY